MVERGICRQCGAEISTAHDECPECGYNPRRTIVILGGVIVVAGAMLIPFIGEYAGGVGLVGAILVIWSFVFAGPTK